MRRRTLSLVQQYYEDPGWNHSNLLWPRMAASPRLADGRVGTLPLPAEGAFSKQTNPRLRHCRIIRRSSSSLLLLLLLPSWLFVSTLSLPCRSAFVGVVPPCGSTGCHDRTMRAAKPRPGGSCEPWEQGRRRLLSAGTTGATGGTYDDGDVLSSSCRQRRQRRRRRQRRIRTGTRLWLRTHDGKNDGNGDINQGGGDFGDGRRPSSNGDAGVPWGHVELPHLLAELRGRGVRFAPDATRADLERMLLLLLDEGGAGGRQAPHRAEGGAREAEDDSEAEPPRDGRSLGGTTAAGPHAPGAAAGETAEKRRSLVVVSPTPDEPPRPPVIAVGMSDDDPPPPVASVGTSDGVDAEATTFEAATAAPAASPAPSPPHPAADPAADPAISAPAPAPAPAPAIPAPVTAEAPALDVRGMALAQVLEELQRRGVRFSPLSTRTELEQLLVEAARTTRRTRGASAPSSFQSDDSAAFGGTATAATVQGEPARHEAPDSPVGHAARRRKPDKSTRDSQQRRPLFQQQQQKQRTRPLRQQRDEEMPQDGTGAPWDAVINWSSSHIPEAVDHAYETAQRTLRKVGRKASDLLAAVDEDGVRDADFTYLYRDEDLYGRVQWLNDEIFDSSSSSSANNGNGKRTSAETRSGAKSSVPRLVAAPAPRFKAFFCFLFVATNSASVGGPVRSVVRRRKFVWAAAAA
jgi:hypothetical protein